MVLPAFQASDKPTPLPHCCCHIAGMMSSSRLDGLVTTILYICLFIGASVFLIGALLDNDADTLHENAATRAQFVALFLENAARQRPGHRGVPLDALDRAALSKGCNDEVFVLFPQTGSNPPTLRPLGGRAFEDRCTARRCSDSSMLDGSSDAYVRRILDEKYGAFSAVNYAGLDVITGFHRSDLLDVSVVVEVFTDGSRFARMTVCASLVIFSVLCLTQVGFGLAKAASVASRPWAMAAATFACLVPVVMMPVLIAATLEASKTSATQSKSDVALATANLLAPFAGIASDSPVARWPVTSTPELHVTWFLTKVILDGLNATRRDRSPLLALLLGERVAAGVVHGPGSSIVPAVGNSSVVIIDGSRIVAARAAIAPGASIVYSSIEPEVPAAVGIAHSVFTTVAGIISLLSGAYWALTMVTLPRGLNNTPRGEEPVGFLVSQSKPPMMRTVATQINALRVVHVAFGVLTTALVMAFVGGMASYYSAAAAEAQEALLNALSVTQGPVSTFVEAAHWFRAATLSANTGVSLPVRPSAVAAQAAATLVSQASPLKFDQYPTWVSQLSSSVSLTTDVSSLTAAVTDPQLRRNATAFFQDAALAVTTFVMTRNAAMLSSEESTAAQSLLAAIAASDSDVTSAPLAAAHAALFNERLRFIALSAQNGAEAVAASATDRVRLDDAIDALLAQNDAAAKLQGVYRQFQVLSVDLTAIAYISWLGLIAVAVALFYSALGIVVEVTHFYLVMPYGRFGRRLAEHRWRALFTLCGIVFAGGIAFLGVGIVGNEGNSLVESQRNQFQLGTDKAQAATYLSVAAGQLYQCSALWSLLASPPLSAGSADQLRFRAVACSMATSRALTRLRTSSSLRFLSRASSTGSLSALLEQFNLLASQSGADASEAAELQRRAMVYFDALPSASEEESLRYAELAAATSGNASACAPSLAELDRLRSFRSWVTRHAVSGDRGFLDAFGNAQRATRATLAACAATPSTLEAYLRAGRRLALLLWQTARREQYRTSALAYSSAGNDLVVYQLQRGRPGGDALQQVGNVDGAETFEQFDVLFWVGMFFTWGLAVVMAGVVTLIHSTARSLFNLSEERAKTLIK